MKSLILYLFSKRYRRYRKHIKGKSFIKFTRGAGYYPLNRGGGVVEVEMSSGKTAIASYLSHENFNDPDDMIEYSVWKLVGYKGMKPISECTWQEFKENYIPIFKKGKNE